jgi:hypothetical protein
MTIGHRVNKTPEETFHQVNKSQPVSKKQNKKQMKNKTMKLALTALAFILFYICAAAQQNAEYYLFK